MWGCIDTHRFALLNNSKWLDLSMSACWWLQQWVIAHDTCNQISASLFPSTTKLISTEHPRVHTTMYIACTSGPSKTWTPNDNTFATATHYDPNLQCSQYPWHWQTQALLQHYYYLNSSGVTVIVIERQSVQLTWTTIYCQKWPWSCTIIRGKYPEEHLH